MQRGGKNNMKTLLVTFVYPIIEEFLNDFFNSLNRQTSRDFDTIVFDDKFNKNLSNFGYKGKIIKNTDNLSIAAVRQYIIDYAIKEEYDLLIFCDADDVMREDRVEKIIEEYKKTEGKYGFYYNNLYLLKEKKDFYKGNLPKNVESMELLKNYNFLGMSHTAINLKLTKGIWNNFSVNDEIVAFDWYMHMYMLLNGYKGKFVDTITYYRIYENNTAGDTNFLNSKKLKIGINVKKEHYKIMKKFDKSYEEEFLKIEKLEEWLQIEKNKENYIKFVNDNFQNSIYWWENIMALDKIGGIK